MDSTVVGMIGSVSNGRHQVVANPMGGWGGEGADWLFSLPSEILFHSCLSGGLLLELLVVLKFWAQKHSMGIL